MLAWIEGTDPFPPVDRALKNPNGLLAAGGDLSVPRLLEAYLIDFDGSLYGEPARVQFVSRLRGEERFEGAEALVDQMNRDVEAARAALSAT